jgi:DNA invertase Pin-like site-specific DNA recombinase
MMGVFAEFERAMIQERVRAGLARARTQGTKSGKPIGRPTISDATERAITKALHKGKGITKSQQQWGLVSELCSE